MEPIIVNEDRTIIISHQRVKVLSALGFTEIDCVIVRWTRPRKHQHCARQISGEWDTASLAQLLAELDKETTLN